VGGPSGTGKSQRRGWRNNWRKCQGINWRRIQRRIWKELWSNRILITV